MKRGPRFKDPAQVPLPLEFAHLVSCSMGRSGDHIMEKHSGGMLYFRAVVLTEGNKKLVGTRVKVSLRTRDRVEAILRRDIALAVLMKAGVLAYSRTGPPEIFMEGQPGEDSNEFLGPADEMGQPWEIAEPHPPEAAEHAA